MKILVVKVIMYIFNDKPVKVASEKEVVTFFDGTLNKNRYTLIDQAGQKPPCLTWNMHR